MGHAKVKMISVRKLSAESFHKMAHLDGCPNGVPCEGPMVQMPKQRCWFCLLASAGDPSFFLFGSRGIFIGTLGIFNFSEFGTSFESVLCCCRL